MASNKANEILDAEMGNEVNLEAIEIENEEQLSFSSSQPRKFIIETCGPVLIINRGYAVVSWKWISLSTY